METTDLGERTVTFFLAALYVTLLSFVVFALVLLGFLVLEERVQRLETLLFQFVPSC